MNARRWIALGGVLAIAYPLASRLGAPLPLAVAVKAGAVVPLALAAFFAGAPGGRLLAAGLACHLVGDVLIETAPLPAAMGAYQRVGEVDAVVSVAGQARFKPLAELTDDDFAFSLRNKLMGQVDVVRAGLDHVRDGGSFTLTSGVLAQVPMVGSAAISLVNGALEGFVRAAALEAPRGIRVNVASPPWIEETLRAMGMTGVPGLPAAAVARAYVRSVTGSDNGAVIQPVADTPAAGF